MAEHSDNVIDNVQKSLQQAGQSTGEQAQPQPTSEQLIDGINQVFSLLRVNYHNQFYAAFSDSDTLNQAKRMWLHTLGHFDTETLLRATKAVIESSEYLPTLHQFMQQCDRLQHQLPTDFEAYQEACMAASKLDTHSWSHAAVYQAGRATGWHTLRSQPERQAFPQFQANFETQKKLLREGKTLALPAAVAEKREVHPLPAAEQKNRLAKLREELDL